MKIKICGLKRIEDIQYVNDALPDYAGFVFAGTKRRISYEQAEILRNRLDKRILAVGVFVNEDINFIEKLVSNNIIDIVQLHGNEDNDYIKKLRLMLKKDMPIIKALSINTADDLLKITNTNADFILLDNGGGGTGTAFNWNILGKSLSENTFLAGGINTENIHEAVKLKPFCIDVSSGVETDGFKDKDKIFEIVNFIRSV